MPKQTVTHCYNNKGLFSIKRLWTNIPLWDLAKLEPCENE